MMDKIKEFLGEYHHPFNESCSKTYTLSMVDLFSCDEWSVAFLSCLENNNHNGFKELLYKVGVDINEDIHIAIKDHRPLSTKEIHRDYVIFYYVRKDKEWSKWATTEQIIDNSCMSMQQDLRRIQNNISYGDENGNIKEYALREDLLSKENGGDE